MSSIPQSELGPQNQRKTWRLPSVGAVAMTLSREAAMLRIVSRNFAGKGARVQELRDSLIAKSHELDKFAESLMELP